MSNLQITKEVKDYLDKALTRFDDGERTTINAAIDRVSKLHEHQSPRPSGEPYINHIIRVASRIVNKFDLVDVELFVAALYHDTVEDQLEGLCAPLEATRNNAWMILSQDYGRRVCEAVMGVTNPEAMGDFDLVVKNEQYINHVINSCNSNNDSFVVKLSDFFDNAMCLQELTEEHIIAKGSKKYRPLFDYFINRLNGDELSISQPCRQKLIDQIVLQRKYVDGLLKKI